jgi:hypothetical protein
MLQIASIPVDNPIEASCNWQYITCDMFKPRPREISTWAGGERSAVKE